MSTVTAPTIYTCDNKACSKQVEAESYRDPKGWWTLERAVEKEEAVEGESKWEYDEFDFCSMECVVTGAHQLEASGRYDTQ